VRSERGFVAVEFALAIGVLLLPVLLLVAAMPSWVERQHAATVAARDAAAVAVGAFPADGSAAARDAAIETAGSYGIAPADVAVAFTRNDLRRGGIVSVQVTVRMPAMVVPGVGTVGGFRWSVVQSRRIDDYRSA
jgi:hypothetical protein